MPFTRFFLIVLTVLVVGITASAQDTPTPEVTPPVTEEPTGEVTEMPLPTPGPDGKITICHVAGRADDPANFRTLNLSPNAVFGPGGHFNENGTARAGHEQDFFGPCPDETPEATSEFACGEVGLDEDGFPFSDEMVACGPDETLERPAISIAIGAPACANWVAYHTNQTGDWELFRVGELPGAPDANPNLSQGIGFHDVGPSRSPDQQWIAFASNRDGNWEIYAAAVNGAAFQRITFNTFAADVDPMWSPVGSQIAYESTRDGNWELYVVDVTTGTETRLTDNPASDRNAFWSPDGTKLVFQSDRDGLWQIYELNVVTQEVRKLSDGSGPDDNPQYSFAGDQIAFRSFRNDSSGVIHLMNADGSNLRAISDPTGEASSHAWSPNDVAVAYQSNLDGDMDIYIYDVASGQTRLLTDNTVADYAPTWICNTPDVVFTSDVIGDPNLFLAPALPVDALSITLPEGGQQLTTNAAADQYPQNTPADEDASRRVVASPVPSP